MSVCRGWRSLTLTRTITAESRGLVYTTTQGSHLLQVLLGLQPPAPALGLDELHLGVEATRKALVVAAVASGADLRVALTLQHAGETLRVPATGALVRWSAAAAWDLRRVCPLWLHLPHWLTDLARTEARETHVRKVS